ncbi:MAG: hypothetical protein AABM43_10315 [Actinomycetota bacterium]
MRLGATQFVRAGAFLAGLAIAAIAVAGWRVPTQSTPGASLKVVAVGTNELQASPAHPFTISDDLKPGAKHGGSGRVALHNTMEQPLAVRIHTVPSVTDLDRLLRVEATGDGQLLFRGRLTDLHSWTRRPFVVPAHGRSMLETRFWLPASVRSGYQNRVATETIEFKLAPARRAG